MWRKVNVGLPDAEDDRNHYDDDLPVQDLEEEREASGIFMGLEVLHDYQLDGKRIISNESEGSKPKKNDKKAKKGNKKKKLPKPSKPDSNSHETSHSAASGDTSDDVKERSNKYERTARSWMSATGVSLRAELCQSLAKRHFDGPTPIQKIVLPSAIHGRRNIVGAAPTGSGKTLAVSLCLCARYDFEDL